MPLSASPSCPTHTLTQRHACSHVKSLHVLSVQRVQHLKIDARACSGQGFPALLSLTLVLFLVMHKLEQPLSLAACCVEMLACRKF